MTNLTPWARNVARYLVGALVAVAPQIAADPVLYQIAGVVIGAAVEVYYILAKRNGWPV